MGEKAGGLGRFITGEKAGGLGLSLCFLTGAFSSSPAPTSAPALSSDMHTSPVCVYSCFAIIYSCYLTVIDYKTQYT
jgi:hypothetical protein